MKFFRRNPYIVFVHTVYAVTSMNPEQGQVLGYTTSPSSPYYFTFIVNKESKVFEGDFVIVRDGEQLILGQIAKIYRRTFHSLDISLAVEKDFVEYRRSVVVAKVRVLGAIRDSERLESAFPVDFGLPVFKAPGDLIAKVAAGENVILAVQLGKIVGTDISIKLDLKRLLEGNILVAGAPGSGKTYTSALLAIQCARNFIPVVIFDMYAEYSALINKLLHLHKKEITIEVKTFSTFEKRNTELLRIDFTEIGPKFLQSFLGLTEIQAEALDNTLRELRMRGVGSPSFDDIYEILKEKKRFHPVARSTLLRKLERMHEMGLFKFEQSTPISHIIRPGKISIIELDRANFETIEMTISWIFNKIMASKDDNKEGVFLILENAHEFRKIIQKILRAGRKYRVSLCVVSDRIAELYELIGLCSNAFLHRILSRHDMEALERHFPIHPSVLKQLPNLRTGEAYIVGDVVTFPVIIRVG